MLFKNREQIIENGCTTILKEKRKHVIQMLTAAVDAVNPYRVVKTRVQSGYIHLEKETLNVKDFQHVYLVAFGKASVGMAQAICDSVEVTKGAVVTNDPAGYVQCRNVSTVVGGHPIPNQQSILGTENIQKIIEQCTENDLLIILISGGGSALLCKPRVSLADLQETTELLLKSGADINEINTIRKHLSYVKGGQLVQSVPCRVISFIISDIVGDPIEFIASGPTSPDSTTFEDAESVLQNYHLWSIVPETVRETISQGIQGKIPETPKEDHEVFTRVENLIVANNQDACNAAAKQAENLGYTSHILSTTLTGEAREVGLSLIKQVNEIPISKEKEVYIAGGETTVTVTGAGRGGRNQEMVLACLDTIKDTALVFTSFATDGIDGKSDAAGAIADGFSFSRAQKKNLSPFLYLKENNSYDFFKVLNDLLMTGTTGTNVMDLHIIIR